MSWTNIPLVSPPAQLTAGQDTTLNFGTLVYSVMIQNKSTSDVYVEFDSAASVASLVIPGGSKALAEFPVRCTTVHIFCAAALYVNGSNDNNLIVKGGN